jgi:two-component sensor histidine kinase
MTDHRPIDLSELLGTELVAHGDGADVPGKVRVDGPPVVVAPKAALALGLVIHELATNALKYGALAQPEGRLSVRWELDDEGPQRRIRLEWRESGVAMAEGGGPARKGYGRELIERALPYELGAKTNLEFGSDGVCCVLMVPAAESEGITHG